MAAKKNIYNLVEKAGRSIGLREGAVKADIVVKDGQPYIYEISNRFHGDVITSHIFNFVGQKGSLESYFHTIYNDNVLPSSFDSVKGKICGWYVLMLSPGRTGRFKINSTKGLKSSYAE